MKKKKNKMIDFHNKDLAVFPCFNLGVGKKFTGTAKGKHNGQDWMWTTKPYSWVMAIQDGIVREVGYGNGSSRVGWYVTLEHQYSDGTKRFSGYIHLYEKPVVKVGQEVKAGQQLGFRGGSPYNSKGKAIFDPHLHLYVTKPVTCNYSWDNMRKYADDPLKLTYSKLKGETYDFAKKDGYNFGATAKYYEDLLYVEKEPDEIKILEDKIEELSKELKLEIDEKMKLQETVDKIREILK